MQNKAEQDRNQEATVYLVSAIRKLNRNQSKSPQGNLDEKCTDALVWELML